MLFILVVLPTTAAMIGYTYSTLRDLSPSRRRNGVGARLATGAVAGGIIGTLVAGLRVATGTTQGRLLVGTIIAFVALGTLIGLGAYFRARNFCEQDRASPGFAERDV